MEPIKVLLADDHALLRQGLCRILDMEEDIEVIAQAADGEEAVALAQAVHPDVVLMDINIELKSASLTVRDVEAVSMYVLHLKKHWQ